MKQRMLLGKIGEALKSLIPMRSVLIGESVRGLAACILLTIIAYIAHMVDVHLDK